MEETNRKHDGKKRTVIIAVVVVAALVAGGLVWWGVAAHRAGTRLAQARQACEWAQTDYATARKTYDDVAKNKTYAAAVKIDAKQVKDAKTVETFAAARKAEAPESVACPTDTKDAAQLERAATGVREAADWYASHATGALEAAEKVVESRDAKTLADARAALDKRVTEARKLYDSSKGKVADGKTRDALKRQLDAAGKLKDATDVKELKDAKAALDKAMDAVNQSVHAKQEEDRKAAQEQAQREAEAQAAAQAQADAQAQQAYTAPQQSYAPAYTAPATPQYTAPQQTAPQYTAPQQAAPAAPAAPVAPSTGGNSGGGPISGGHGCGSVCTSTTDTYDR
ncbi:MAG: hypothetical protein U0N15_00385 [Bifidobacterium choerinum]